MSSNVPSNSDFAQEVRINRLGILWKVTLVICGILAWLFVSLAVLDAFISLPWLAALVVMAGGCLFTGVVLRRGGYALAVWVYALSMIAAFVPPIIATDVTTQQVLPFIYPILIFIVGLMLPPVHTLALAILASCLLFGIFLVTASAQINYALYAIALMFVSALFSAQVTGELYQITEWALMNYKRERRTNDELFNSRQELQHSLKRSQVLSERLQETNTELEVARQAAEEAKHFRGQFLANMSHELRTPLNAIIGFSETMLRFPMMYDDVPLPNAYEADLNQIYTSGRHLLHLINDILDLAKVDAGKLEVQLVRVELKPIIEGALATASGLVGNKPIELRKNLPEPLPHVLADEKRLRQVLLNLYSNASKFTDSGAITLFGRVTAEGFHFSVQDTGCGIAPEDLPVIFEEFRQANSAVGRDPRSGAGLGLAISKQLVTLMGGRIWVESEVGHGSTFHFVIPLAPTEAVHVNGNQPTASTQDVPLAQTTLIS